MKSFREYLQQQQAQVQTWAPQPGGTPKAWKAEKADVLKHWQELNPGTPFGEVRAIPRDHKGPTYGFDGMRITGSAAFIDSVLSRLKDLLGLESEDSRLALIYRQQVNNKTEQPVPNSYVFYLQIKKRSATDSGLPEPEEVKPFKPHVIKPAKPPEV